VINTETNTENHTKITKIITFPFYAKFAFTAIGTFAFMYTMYVGQQIILPLIYATIIAILLNPFVNFLVKKHFNRLLAIFIAVFVAILITISLLYLVSAQVTLFSETYPKLKDKFNVVSVQAIQWISEQFNIKTTEINKWIVQTENDLVNKMGGAIGETLSMINSFLIVIFLLPVYLFMILYYKPLLLEFINKLFNPAHHQVVFDILNNSKRIIQSYLIGLLVEAAIIASLNSMGLLLIGIDYAIIIAITGALLNVIPYIGGIIAIAVPMLIAFVTKESSTYTLLVFGWYILIQFIDNHFIIPSVVASKVKINALISVIAVLVGGALWGIPGMFLSIPLTAILKVIFDHVEPLKPLGFLLGNIVPTNRLRFDFIKRKKNTA
jgi:predicted PurR-regulated permease PerM